ncbi:MAG: hypothetical protein H6739_17345 [Alphaproteobacteria bacterium]|nr:hypothetical protein [Alphaproteobacteria bacterium]
MLLLTLTRAALAQDLALLAPTPQELRAGMGTLETRLDHADAVAESLQAVHNAWAQALVALPGRPACDDARLGSLAARSEVFGVAYRDLVQSARVASTRVQRMAAAPTVQAVAEGVLAADLTDLEARLAVHERGYAELAAWQQAELTPYVTRCKPALTAGAGEPGARILQPDPGPVAVLALEGGVPHPTRALIHPSVWLVPPEACWAPIAGTCTPAPVAPGAALGPADQGSATE